MKKAKERKKIKEKKMGSSLKEFADTDIEKKIIKNEQVVSSDPEYFHYQFSLLS